jgi:hypothetical protein
MRRILTELRNGGVSFASAWRAAFLYYIEWPRAREREWHDVLTSTRDEWQAAYERRDTPLSVALTQLSQLGAEEQTSPGRRLGAETLTDFGLDASSSLEAVLA